MPIVTYTDFSVGKDLRKGESVADANRLRELKNGYVTAGKAIKKRPGTELIKVLETGTAGLFASGGVLHTFTQSGSVVHSNVRRKPKYRPVGSNALDDMSSSGTYSGTANSKFIIEIDGVGTPDTFKWQKDNVTLASGVSITGSSQGLSDGVSVGFVATTGHTLEDKWEVECLVFTPNQVIGSNVGSSAFSGSGANDLISGGAYSGTGTPTFTVEIDGRTTGSISAMAEDNVGAITAVGNEATGSITAMADAGGGNTTITSASHGLSNSDRTTISATSSYNGVYTIAGVTANTFQIVKAFVTDEATGSWGANATITSAAHGLINGNSVVISGNVNYNGTYTISGVATNTFNIIKEFTSTGTGKWTLNPNPTLGETIITSNSHGLSNGDQINITGTTSYNQLVSISGATTNTFIVPITFVANDGTGTWEKLSNTFKWKKDSGAYTTGVVITTSAQALSDSVTVTFGSKFGHVLTDNWTITITTSLAVSNIHYADSYNGLLYVAVEYTNGNVLHHYLDGANPTRIADTNCPNSKGVVKMENKIWAVDGDVVRFSATGNPRDWTTSSDAGFLAVGLKQRGSDNALALGQYKEKNLIVFFADGSQLWSVDPDPANHQFAQSLPGIHTRYHRSVAILFQDMYVLTDFGFRSISESVLTSSQAEIDIGSPVDSVVQSVLPQAPTVNPKGKFSPQLGQYICVIQKKVFVFTISKTAKITAWSEYELPWEVDDLTILDSEVYLRSGDNVYRLSSDIHRDSYESNKSITAYSANGTETTVTSTAHGRANGDEVIISGTTNYNGTFIIKNVTTNTFDIPTAYVANDATGLYDAGTLYEFEMQMAFIDAKKPGILKQWMGVDTVTDGSVRLAFKFLDGSGNSFTTDEMTLSGDTRPGEMVPVELTGVNIAPVMKNNSNEAFQVDAISMYYQNLVPL